MKKFVSILCVMLVFAPCGFCFNLKDEISVIEKELFSAEYGERPVTARLSAIEKFLYGKQNSGTDIQRLQKIKETTGINPTPVKVAQNPSQYEFSQNSPKSGGKNIYDYPSSSANYASSPNVSYPIVDKMEEKVFGKTFKDKDITERLAKLEQKTFGKISDKDLNARTDMLKASILAHKQEKITYGNDYEPHVQRNYHGQIPGNERAITESDYNYGLSTAERLVFGDSRPGESRERRLSNLEKKIFHKTFENEPSSQRLERVVAAAAGQKTARGGYDKWEKYLSTGIQVGGILLMILAMIL